MIFAPYNENGIIVDTEFSLERCLILRDCMHMTEIEKEIERILDNSAVDHLFLSRLDFEKSGQLLSSSVKRLFRRRKHRWITVTFETCQGHIDGLIKVLFETSAVDALSINSMFVNEAISMAVRRGLQRDQSKLKRLTFAGSKLPTRSVQMILEGLSTSEVVENVRFNNSQFLDGAAVVLAGCISSCHSIRQLELFSCGLSDEDAAKVTTSLQGHPALTYFDLGHNQCASKTMSAVGELLKTSTTLHTLNLSLQRSRLDNHFLEISQLCKGLTNNKSLKVLYLRGNPLDNGDFAQISQALLQNETLEKLILTDCLLDKDSIQGLLAHLSDIKSLRCLWLDGCQSIGLSPRKEVVETAAHSLSKNVSLELLHLPFGFAEHRSELDFFLDLNRGGRKLLLKPQGYLSLALWPVILERVNRMQFPDCAKDEEQQSKRRANIMYFLLRERVSLER